GGQLGNDRGVVRPREVEVAQGLHHVVPSVDGAADPDDHPGHAQFPLGGAGRGGPPRGAPGPPRPGPPPRIGGRRPRPPRPPRIGRGAFSSLGGRMEVPTGPRTILRREESSAGTLSSERATSAWKADWADRKSTRLN